MLPPLVAGRRYAFNIIFNLLNKTTLNMFPAPYFISTLQLGTEHCSLQDALTITFPQLQAVCAWRFCGSPGCIPHHA